MRIALINSSPSAKLYPVGLLKIGSMLKKRGDTCELFDNRLPNAGEFDEIWVGTVFTFDVPSAIALVREAKTRADVVRVGGVAASLLPEPFKRAGGIVHVGLHPAAEMETPDYSLLKTTPKYSITHTSRGCVRKCEFCMVPKIEPKFYRRESWPDDILPDTEEILFYDNNFLAQPVKVLREEADKIAHVLKTTKNKMVDFNQGTDCRLLTDEKADILASIKLKRVIFAFDGMHEDGHLQKAVQKMAERGKKNFTIFVLYNFNDTPQDFYYRLHEVARLATELDISCTSFPMRYQPIMAYDTKREYIGTHWTEGKRKNFMNILNKQSIMGQISRKVEDFEYWFTDSAEKFDKLLSWDKCGEYAARKKGASRTR